MRVGCTQTHSSGKAPGREAAARAAWAAYCRATALILTPPSSLLAATLLSLKSYSHSLHCNRIWKYESVLFQQGLVNRHRSYVCPQLIPYDWWKRTIMTSKCDTVEDKWLRSLLMSTSLTAFAPEDTWAYPQHFRMRSKQLFPMDGSLPVSFLGSSSTDWYKDNWLCHRTAFFVQKAKWSGFCNGECVGCSAVCPAVCKCACAVCFGGEGWGVIHDVGQNHYHKWIETTPAREPSLQAMDAQNT